MPFRRGGEAAYYLALNRGKKSLTLNLKTDKACVIVWALANRADVLVENFHPGAMERWGLGYESLRAPNPGLIYCAITGYGQYGPYRDRLGYDFIIQAQGGAMSITGPREGPVMKVGVTIVDATAGLYAAIAILAALDDRQQGGLGQYIDTALLDAQSACILSSNRACAGGQNIVQCGSSSSDRGPAWTPETPALIVVLGAPRRIIPSGGPEGQRVLRRGDTMVEPATLSQVEMFEGLAVDQLRRLAAISREVEYHRGDVIFRENTPGDSTYIVLDGEVDIQVDPHILGGQVPAQARPTPITVIRRWQSFGEVSLVDSGVRSASAVCASERVLLLAFQRDAFLQMCQKNPAIGYRIMLNIASDLASRIRTTDFMLPGRPPLGPRE